MLSLHLLSILGRVAQSNLSSSLEINTIVSSVIHEHAAHP